MIKRMVLTAVSALLLMAASVMANDTQETSKFFYTRNGSDLTVSVSGEGIDNKTGEDADIIFAVYDGEVLTDTKIVKLDKQAENVVFDDVTFDVGEAENIKVKAFMWSDDGKYRAFDKVSEVRDLSDKTVTFKASAVADVEGSASHVESLVCTADSSADIQKYRLAEDAEFYVNDVCAGVVTNALIDEYIFKNINGTVTVVDTVDKETGVSDGIYDKIMVDHYIDAVVDYVVHTSSHTRIYFKESQTAAKKLEWDHNDPGVEITFTKNGEEISYTDLNEYDVLSIRYDVLNEGKAAGSLTNKDHYEIIVSDKTADGIVKSKDAIAQTITLDDEVYALIDQMTTTGDYDIYTDYKIYIDAFGYVAYVEVTCLMDYGVIVGSYMEAVNDYPTVRIIRADAKVVEYECVNDNEAKMFYNYAVNGDAYGTDEWQPFTKNTIREQIRSGATVCRYKFVGGKIKFDKACICDGGSELVFDAQSSKIGAYAVEEKVTYVIDMEAYMKNETDKADNIRLSELEDKSEYTAFFYDKNSNDVYRFAIIFDMPAYVRSITPIAVVKSANDKKDTDSCKSYTVEIAGNEVEILVEDSVPVLTEGTVIAYVTGPQGYVEEGDLYVLYSPASDYDTLFADVTGGDDFGASLRNVKTVDGRHEIAYNGKTSSSKDVFAYLGVVYTKSAIKLKIFTEQTSGVSNISKVMDFNISGANVYTFDYHKRANRGARLLLGNSASQRESIFNSAYQNDRNEVVWADLDGATPQIAFIKEVNGAVTDVVFYVAP